MKSAQPVEAKPLVATAPETQAESNVMTEEVAEAPVLLANPPEDKPEETPSNTPQETAEETTPVLAAAPIMEAAPIEKPDEKSEPVAEKQPEPQPVAQVIAQPEPEQQLEPEPQAEQAAAPVALAQTITQTSAQKNQNGEASEKKSDQAAGNESAALPSESASGMGNNQTGTGSTNESKGTGSGTVITGPIRDASELKALPGNPNPVYPQRDRLNRKQGTAFVLGRVMPDGRIGQVVLEKSSGSPSMDAESAKAFRNWRFQPGQQGWVRKPFQFRLVGDAKEVPAALGKQLKRQ
jgi:TonB family protein